MLFTACILPMEHIFHLAVACRQRKRPVLRKLVEKQTPRASLRDVSRAPQWLYTLRDQPQPCGVQRNIRGTGRKERAAPAHCVTAPARSTNGSLFVWPCTEDETKPTPRRMSGCPDVVVSLDSDATVCSYPAATNWSTHYTCQAQG